jgi:hypothetical protein
MSLKIINKSNFVQKFLTPISKINELCSLTLENNSISNLNRTADTNFSLYALTDDVKYEGPKRSISFADIKRFIKVLDCINSDENIDLTLNENSIEYSSHSTRFKFHLIDDNIVRGPSFSIDKINSLEFDCEFSFNHSSYMSLIKSSTFIIDSSKIYLHNEGENVIAELTDKTKSNIDTYSTVISNSFKGDQISKPIGFDFDLFKNVSFPRNGEIKIKLNTKIGFVAFEIQDGNYKLKYIATAKMN